MHIKVTTPLNIKGDFVREQDVKFLRNKLFDALSYADSAGLLVEVVLESIPPLAQGRYEAHIHIRERKDLGMARETAAITTHDAMLSQWAKLGKTGETADAPAGKVILAHGVK